MRIPTKKILWAQVFAALFAAIMTIICFFTPITSLKASGNVGGLFDDYLTVAMTAKLEDAKTDAEKKEVVAEFEGYAKMILEAEEKDEDGNRKGIRVGLSASSFIFNVGNMVNMIKHIGQIKRVESLTKSMLEYPSQSTADELKEVQTKLAEADFDELNETSFGLAYFFSAFIYESAEDTLTNSESVDDVGNKIISFIMTIAFIVVVLLMCAVAAICAIILLVGMLSHIKAPENYYEKASKRASNLIYTTLFATFLGLTASNGGGLGVGGVLTVITSILVLGIYVAAAYLKKNSPAQLKYLITTHAVGAISVFGIFLAYIGTTAAGLGEWLFSASARTQMWEIATKAAAAGDTKKLASMLSTAGLIYSLSLVLNLVLITYMLNVFIHSVMLTETKKVSVKSNPAFIAVATLLIVFLPFILTIAVIGLEVPSSIIGSLVISWIGAIIFAVAQFGRGWAYNKFTNISITEKALLLAGFPDGEGQATAPVAEEAPAEAPVEAPAEVAATESSENE